MPTESWDSEEERQQTVERLKEAIDWAMEWGEQEALLAESLGPIQSKAIKAAVRGQLMGLAEELPGLTLSSLVSAHDIVCTMLAHVIDGQRLPGRDLAVEATDPEETEHGVEP